MSLELEKYLVILKDHGADVDITKHVNVLEYNDTAPISTKLTLNAFEGRFITKGDKIQKWDRIYVEITDRKGKVTKTVVHVEIRKKQRKTGKGLELVCWCPHQSSNLLAKRISKPNRRVSGKTVVLDAVAQLNDPINKGSADPTIVITDPFDITEKNGVRLTEGVTNNYPCE